MSAIAFSKRIGPVRLNCFLSEKHESNLEITENPIETGAVVNDHAYMVPKRVTLDIVDENAAQTFNALVRFQETRIPFTVVTGLTVYRNMLVKGISADRDKTYSNVLRATVDLQEVIIVSTATIPVDVQQAGTVSPGQPGGVNSTRASTPSVERAGDSVTADRVTGTAQRGDSPMTPVDLPAAGPVTNQSLLSSALFP